MDALTTVNAVLMNPSASDWLAEWVAGRLARFCRPAQLRREIEEILEDLTKKKIRLKQEAFDELVGKANEIIAYQSGEKPQKVAQKQVAFLQSIIADRGEDTRSQLAANAQLTDLVGTSSKQRSEFHEPGDAAHLTRKMLAEMEEIDEMEDAKYS